MIKLRRTLPSVHDHPTNYPVSQNPSTPDTLIKMLSSPQSQPQPPTNRASAMMESPMNRLSETAKRKSVSFVLSEEQNSKNQRESYKEKGKEQGRQQSSRKIRRSKIFQRSRKQQQPVPTNLNIKLLSNQLAKTAKLNVQQKIIKKIAHLQNMVTQIHQKVSSKQAHDHRIVISPRRDRNQNEIANNVLKLQLEQMRRCEKIAKESQILYGKLVKSLENSENQLVGSRKKSIESIHNSKKRIEISNSNSKKKNVHRVTVFQDLEQYERKNASFLQQSDTQVEIVSPFSLQDNRGKIKLTR